MTTSTKPLHGERVEEPKAWAPGDFLIAAPDAPQKRAGYVYRGLGLHMIQTASPKGCRPPTWRLTHLGSGHSVCNIIGFVKTTFPIAAEIAECGDWGFDGLRGYINRDPTIVEKAKAVFAKYPKAINRVGGNTSSEEIARAIVMARDETPGAFPEGQRP